MGKKIKLKVKKITKSKKPDTQVCRKELQMFFRKLQQVVKESSNDGEISQDCTLLHTNINKEQTLSERDSTFVHTTNIRNEGPTCDNYKCRCKCLLEIPSNIFPPPSNRRIPSFIGQCEVQVSFIQAIVWLKSVTACIPQISVEKLQQLFDKRCNIRDNYNYDENKHTEDVHVESSLTTFVNKTPSINEMLNDSERFITPILKNISDFSCNVISPIIYKSYTDLEDIQNETFNFVSSPKDQNKSIVELSKSGTSAGYVMINQEKRKEFFPQSYIIPDSDKESLSDLNDTFEKSITSDDLQELLQNFEPEQASCKNFNKRVNNEIIEDESISLKNDANSSSKSVSSARSQSIESISNWEYNSDNNCIIALTSQHNVTDNMETSDYDPNNFTNYLTQPSNINISQISFPISCVTSREQNNVNNFQTDRVQSRTLHDDYNDDDFKYQIDDNSPCTWMKDTVIENEKNDSAYSTWQIETLNYDAEITTKLITANKPDTNISHHCNLRPRKKKVIKHEEATASPSLIQKPVRKGQCSTEKWPSSKKRKSESAKNLLEKKKETKDKNETFSFMSSLKDQNKSIIELSKPGTCAGYVMTNQEKRKDFLSQPYIIPDSDEESLLDLNDTFEKSVMSDDLQELLQNFEPEQASCKNFNKRVNNEIIEDESISSTLKNDANSSSKSVSSARSQFIESIFNFEYNSDNNCIISLTSQHNVTDNMETSDYDPNNFPNYLIKPSNINISQISFPISCVTPREQNNVNNFQIDRVQSRTLHDDYNDDDFKYQINDNNSCIQMSDTVIENEKNDSAYSTWQIETLNYDAEITKPITANKPDTNVRHHYNLRPRKKKVIKHEEAMVSPSLMQKPVRKGQCSTEKRSLSQKRKSELVKNLSEEKNASWLDFTVELLNAEHIIHTSVKVILLTLCDKRTAQEYAMHGCWKDSLEEQAINAVLNIVDILRMEKKSNICEKEIETTIIATLDEMMTCVQLNEIWISRIQIILQFCHLLPICVRIINYLISILETLQSALIDAENRNEKRSAEINQLHLVLYALDIALRTYCVLVPRDNKSQPAKTATPYIADLWKMRYREENEKLEDISFDPDAEKQWINILKKFTTVSTKHYRMVQFADVSFLLYHTLISAS